jgi:hypothetical protein
LAVDCQAFGFIKDYRQDAKSAKVAKKRRVNHGSTVFDPEAQTRRELAEVRGTNRRKTAIEQESSGK